MAEESSEILRTPFIFRLGIILFIYAILAVLQATVLNDFGPGYDRERGAVMPSGLPPRQVFVNWTLIQFFAVVALSFLAGITLPLSSSTGETPDRNRARRYGAYLWQNLTILAASLILSSIVVFSYDQATPKPTNPLQDAAIVFALFTFGAAIMAWSSLFSIYYQKIGERLVTTAWMSAIPIFLLVSFLNLSVIVIPFLILEMFLIFRFAPNARVRLVLFIVLSILDFIVFNIVFNNLGLQNLKPVEFIQNVAFSTQGLVIIALIFGGIACGLFKAGLFLVAQPRVVDEFLFKKIERWRNKVS